MKRSDIIKSKSLIAIDATAIESSEPQKPSVWASHHRRLTRRQSDRPGMWKNENSPVLRGIMDLCADDGIEELTIKKAAQIGGSESVRNFIGYCAHNDPDPIMLVLPSEDIGRRIMARRILPLFQDTPCLSRLMTNRANDTQLTGVYLANGFTLQLAWSGSPGSLSADPQRVVINDEVDKFVEWSGRESDPVSLARMRTQTYSNRLIINISTPTIPSGMISRLFDSSPIKLYPFFSCLKCGAWQRIVFQRIRWEKFDEKNPDLLASMIRKRKAAWYECDSCGCSIKSGNEKWRFLQTVTWATLDQVIEGPPGGQRIIGDLPESYKVGCHIWAAHATWIEWHDIASAFIAAKADRLGLQNFSNSWLGEVFQEQVESPKRSTLIRKSESEHPVDKVPSWAGVLVATADTQKDHFWYTLRAWGNGRRSVLVKHGKVETLNMLEELCLHTNYQVIDRNGSVVASMMPSLLLIDSGGHRTQEVYLFAESNPDRIFPTKGASHQQRSPVVSRRVSYKSPGEKESVVDVQLQMFDVGHYKDELARLQQTSESDPDHWQLNDKVDDEYISQMSSQHKVMVRSKSGQRMIWETISSGARDHLWDCEVLQCVSADIVHANLLPTELELIDERKFAAESESRMENLIKGDDGDWLMSYKGRW